MLGFLNSLCGPRAAELKVKDRETYNFNPRKLIETITTIVIRIWKQESNMATSDFTTSMALHPEYSATTMYHVESLLARDNQAGAQAFALFMKNVCYRELVCCTCVLGQRCVCACVHVCVCVWMYMWMFVHVCTCACVYVHVCGCVCTCVCGCVCACVCACMITKDHILGPNINQNCSLVCSHLLQITL